MSTATANPITSQPTPSAPQTADSLQLPTTGVPSTQIPSSYPSVSPIYQPTSEDLRISKEGETIKDDPNDSEISDVPHEFMVRNNESSMEEMLYYIIALVAFSDENQEFIRRDTQLPVSFVIIYKLFVHIITQKNLSFGAIMANNQEISIDLALFKQIWNMCRHKNTINCIQLLPKFAEDK